MMRYLYRDMVSAMEYLPYGLALGVPAAAVFTVLFFRNKKAAGEKEKGTAFLRESVPFILFVLYLAILLVITFLSRESGSRIGKADFELFSTWGINDRNNAYVVENVLLFLPWGFIGCLAFPRLRGLLRCAFFGALTSVAIECMQLLTGRGYFQIDDILTNVLGAAAGYALYRLCFSAGRKKKPD